MSKLHLFLVNYLGLHYLALPVFGSFRYLTLACKHLCRSLEINAIWTFDTEFPTFFNKSCTYITFKSAVKHRQLGYGYPRGQIVHLAEATTQDTYSNI